MQPAVAIIINGISRRKKLFYNEILPVVSAALPVEVFETARAGHAVILAREAARKNFDFIIAAGGDGTLNQVVNGVLSAGITPAPVVGLIPLGTGNDFAKMCGLTPDPHTLIRLLQHNHPRPVDIGKIHCHTEEGTPAERYFINAASMGMGPEVVKRLERSDRSLGPFLTYWKAITSAFFTHRPQEVQCKMPDGEWHGKIRVLVVANGQSFGNSLHIAPDALPDDGVLNTFIAGEIPLMKFLVLQQKLKSKIKVDDHRILYNQAKVVEVSAPEPTLIETEGEIAGYLPARIEVMPGALRFLR